MASFKFARCFQMNLRASKFMFTRTVLVRDAIAAAAFSAASPAACASSSGSAPPDHGDPTT